MPEVVDMANSALVTSAQAAAEHGVSVSTVARMARRGQLRPVAKVPGLRGAYLFDRRHVADVFADAAASRPA